MSPSDGSVSQSRRSDGSRGRQHGRNTDSNGRAGAARRGRGRDRREQPQTPSATSGLVAANALKVHDVGTPSTAAVHEDHDDYDDDDDDDDEVCFICANPITYHSIAPCNHTSCHICGLRMRALYKTKDCPHCRTPSPFVIFTDNAKKRFEDYSSEDITTTDGNIGIKYAKEDIVGDTVLLLRYNCPDASCDFAGLGWPDLHRHVKSAHSKRMCDLCTRNKKLFTHEHTLYPDRDLDRHMRHGDDEPGAANQTGFKGHPLCGFCGERFYDDDKLYEHCRMKHERCFICDRRDSRKPHYYRDYDALEKHFRNDHYLCSNSDCLEKKFVVFESEMDLQAHQLSEHVPKAAGRDARVVDISAFDIRQAYHQERRGGQTGRVQRDSGAQGRGRGRGGARGRDPNGEPIMPTTAQPLRRDELAFQRQMAVRSAQSGNNRSFGGQLTPSAPAQSSASTQSSVSRQRLQSSDLQTSIGATDLSETSLAEAMDSSNLSGSSITSPTEHARRLRHSSVVERAANLLGNDAAKLADFREYISTYRRGAHTAPQLIDAFFTLFADASSNALGTLVREVAELFEDKAKADDLRRAWQNWRAINEDYPSLPGLSGMHGAMSSSTGWATASAANPAVPTAAPSRQHTNRVLKLKNSTKSGGPAPRSPSGPPGWAAASSSAMPTSSTASFPSLRTVRRATGASNLSENVSRAGLLPSAPQSVPSIQVAPASSRGRVDREDAFPALPSAPKPMTTLFGYGSGRGVRRDYGHASSSFQWGSGVASGSSGGGNIGGGTPGLSADRQREQDANGETEGGGGGGGGKGKKGGKKGKKVLVQWG